MTLSSAEIAQLLITLFVVLVSAHMLGNIFSKLNQPPVIGEILGGLLLGPTVLGAIAPDVMASLFPDGRPTAAVLGAIYQLGLMLLMFLAGSEVDLRGTTSRERRTILSSTLIGLVVACSFGVLVASLLDHTRFSGPYGSEVSFALIFGIVMAVSSIPVISRIFMDMRILHTSLARIVLGVAVLQDLLLYAVLGVVLAMAQAQSGTSYGLWAIVGIDSPSLAAAYYVGVTLLFITVFLLWGTRAFHWLATGRFNVLEWRHAATFRLVFMLLGALLCLLLGINPIFGALVAGISVSRADATHTNGEQRERARDAWAAIKQFSLSFFIPIYFAMVGVQLNLQRDLDVLFFLWFFAIATIAATGSVFLGAKLAGESGMSALNIAVALNARGGPGIVLASITYGAGVINEKFFTSLVVLAIVSSQAAGVWVDRFYVRRLDPDLRVPEPRLGSEQGS
jgi:Kef-type K+ transport system membrane component KefB